MIKRIVFLAIVAALIYGAVTLFREEAPQPTTDHAALSVTVITPEEGSIATTIPATGVTIPREEIQIMTELSGVRVRDVLADVGERVKKGQTLAVLDGQSLANQVAQLQSDYERARDAYERVDAIKDTGAVSKQSVTEKHTAMQSAKAMLDNAKLDARRSTIAAPEDGLVFERNAVLGGLVSGSEPLFRLARFHDIELEAQVPESALSGLKPGQKAAVTLTGETSPIEGEIRLITPKVDSTSRMAAIRISLERETPIPVGLFATVRILQAEREGLLLPKTAIQQDSTGHFVWVLNADRSQSHKDG